MAHQSKSTRELAEENRDIITKIRPAFPIQSKRAELFSCENSTDPLPDGYKLTKYDVINGRGRFENVGNRRFHLTCALNLKRYYEAKSRTTEKTMIVLAVFEAMRDARPSGAFLKIDRKRKGGWLAVGGSSSKKKIGHCMRDMIILMQEEKSRKKQLEILMEEKSCEMPLRRAHESTMQTEMTPEQCMVLRRLESGYEGPVDKLLSTDWEQGEGTQNYKL